MCFSLLISHTIVIFRCYDELICVDTQQGKNFYFNDVLTIEHNTQIINAFLFFKSDTNPVPMDENNFPENENFKTSAFILQRNSGGKTIKPNNKRKTE